MIEGRIEVRLDDRARPARVGGKTELHGGRHVAIAPAGAVTVTVALPEVGVLFRYMSCRTSVMF